MFLDPADSQQPRPSSKAIQLPEHMSKAPVKQTNTFAGVPEPDDVFNDDPEFKWAEFNAVPHGEIQNPYQRKVDLEKKVDQIWHYLGKTSTEARAQYTENPRKEAHNPKSSFLESVKPPYVPSPSQARPRHSMSHPMAPRPNIYSKGQGPPAKPNGSSDRSHQSQSKRESSYSVDHSALTAQQSFLSEAKSYAYGNQQPSSQSHPNPPARRLSSFGISQPPRPIPAKKREPGISAP